MGDLLTIGAKATKDNLMIFDKKAVSIGDFLSNVFVIGHIYIKDPPTKPTFSMVVWLIEIIIAIGPIGKLNA